MIEETKMWKAVCDTCKDVYELYDGVIALDEKSAIIDSIKFDQSEWSLLEDGKIYCPDCHFREWDEDKDAEFAYKDNKILGYLDQ